MCEATEMQVCVSGLTMPAVGYKVRILQIPDLLTGTVESGTTIDYRAV